MFFLPVTGLYYHKCILFKYGNWLVISMFAEASNTEFYMFIKVIPCCWKFSDSSFSASFLWLINLKCSFCFPNMLKLPQYAFLQVVKILTFTVNLEDNTECSHVIWIHVQQENKHWKTFVLSNRQKRQNTFHQNINRV